MKKAPHTNKVLGAYGEQLSFLPRPEFSSIFPEIGTLKHLALQEMLKAPITQISWLSLGYGWRLSATINSLNKSGWNVISERCLVNGKSIAIYSLSEKSREEALTLLNKEVL